MFIEDYLDYINILLEQAEDDGFSLEGGQTNENS